MARSQHRSAEAGIENLRQTGIEIPVGVIHDEATHLATLSPREPVNVPYGAISATRDRQQSADSVEKSAMVSTAEK